jgi:antitoxin (DNA-binding transcriptional repressor) of toxin-antitoxin stability system
MCSNFYIVKTVTINDLQARLPTVPAWVKRGEDVMVKGEPVAHPVTDAETLVGWSRSAAFNRDRTGEKVLTQQDLDELFEDMRGPY